MFDKKYNFNHDFFKFNDFCNKFCETSKIISSSYILVKLFEDFTKYKNSLSKKKIEEIEKLNQKNTESYKKAKELIEKIENIKTIQIQTILKKFLIF